LSAQQDDPMLRQLLGPSERELTCDECFDQLDRFVELELAGADADHAVPGLRPHLEGCPACRDEHESLIALVEAHASDDEGRWSQPGSNR
jgi:hypothetical protein